MISVGEILKQERLKKGIDLLTVEAKTKIRQKFLDSIERNDWHLFSSKVYISGIIRTYSLFLGLDPEKTLAFFRRDYEKKEDVRFKKKVTLSAVAPQSRRVIFAGLTLICLLFILYFAYQLTLYFSPPRVTLLSPNQTTVSTQDKINIVGVTDKEASVTIYGQRVFLNKDGIFEYTFPLKKGNNELIIEVIGANGKKTIFKKNFVKTS